MLIVTHFHATTRATRPAMSFAIDPESASTATPSTRRWARRERSRIADAYGHRRALALGLLILRAQRREHDVPVDGSDHPVTCRHRCCR